MRGDGGTGGRFGRVGGRVAKASAGPVGLEIPGETADGAAPNQTFSAS